MNTVCSAQFSTLIQQPTRYIHYSQGRKNRGGWAIAPPHPDFWQISLPYFNQDFSHQITTRPPGFSDLPTTLILHTPLLLTLQEAISVAELSSTVVAAATKAERRRHYLTLI